jgi:hypothetical protein
MFEGMVADFDALGVLVRGVGVSGFSTGGSKNLSIRDVFEKIYRLLNLEYMFSSITSTYVSEKVRKEI